MGREKSGEGRRVCSAGKPGGELGADRAALAGIPCRRADRVGRTSARTRVWGRASPPWCAMY